MIQLEAKQAGLTFDDTTGRVKMLSSGNKEATAAISGLNKATNEITKSTKEYAPGVISFGEATATGSKQVTTASQNITDAFKKLQDRETILIKAYESGVLTQSDYIEKQKELSREYDILTRNTTELKGAEKDSAENWQRRVENLVNHYNAGLLPADSFIAKLKELADTWLGAGDILADSADKIKTATSNLYSPNGTPGDIANQKSLSQGMYTGYDAQFYQNAIDQRVKDTADAVIKNGLIRGLSNAQIAYDMDQQIQAVLMRYPGQEYVDRAETQKLTDQYVSNYSSDDYINSIKEGKTATQQATSVIQSFSQSLSSFGLTADQAAVMQQKYNDIARDGVAANGEAVDYLARFKQQTGDLTQYTQQNITETQGLLQAMIQAGQAQDQYTKYMSDGSLSAQEAADMNSRLAEINRILGDAGLTATGGVGNLPPALQSLATYATNAAAQINAAVQSANAAVASAQQYITQVRSYVGQFTPDSAAVKMSDKPTIVQNVNMSNMTFGASYDPGQIMRTAYSQISAGL